MRAAGPVTTDIVLVGGGHAHVHVLAAFARHPAAGIRLTLVARDLQTPYSGMLPGLVAGLYTHDQAHIDLVRLAAATGARLIHGEAVGLDRAAKRLVLEGRPPIAYDLLSIDVGITPDLSHIAGAAEHGIAVKPIGSFLAKFETLRSRVRVADGLRRIAVIGGGAGGVELALSLQHRLARETTGALEFSLVTEGEILTQHNEAVRHAFRRILKQRGIDLRERMAVAAIEPGRVLARDGSVLPADAVLVTTHAAAPGWFRDTGLALDKDGFVAVDANLQSIGDTDIFAAGDCAALTASPRPKSGVFAVRAGPRLAENLRRRALGRPTLPWKPQCQHLALISTGERYAVASRGRWKAEGAWLWTFKDWIDRRWMRMYQDVDRMIARMAHPAATSPAPADPVAAMRCGGCAAKVGPGPLSRALARLAGDGGAFAPQDAALLPGPPSGRQTLQTVDYFRAFTDDPFRFGAIAANHALNDIFASGGEPRHAMAIAAVPPDAPAKVEEALFQMLAGARQCLDREGVALAGGHTGEGTELALGFAVTGDVAPDRLRRKSGLRAGDALVLTKPIGTGVIFAAAMRAKAAADAVTAALESMRQSNRAAAGTLIAHGAGAMTDVTGFGLVGHLGEMLAASGAAASLDLAAVPLLPGARALAIAGTASSLLPANLELAALLQGAEDPAARALLFDPQTAGGLVAGIPQDRASACVDALRQAGYAAAAIGRVTETGLPASAVRLVASGKLAA